MCAVLVILFDCVYMVLYRMGTKIILKNGKSLDITNKQYDNKSIVSLLINSQHK
jgi:hypothetical protein